MQLDMIDEVPQIRVTKNYEIFKLLKENRDVIESKVASLAKAIKKKNMLKTNPIIVNSYMYVMEGQHRLAAAKILGVPIYYIIDDAFEIQDMISLNTHRCNWTGENYVKYYAERGFEEYIKLKDFLSENKVSVKIGMLMLVNVDNDRTYPMMKEGSFKFEQSAVNKQFVRSFVRLRDLLKSINFRPTVMLTNTTFIRSTKLLFESPFVDHETFFQQADRACHLFRSRHTVAQYLEMFSEIYNFRMRLDKIRVLQTGSRCSIIE